VRVIEAPVPDRSDVIGKRRIVRASDEDTFPDIARRHDIGYLELMAANPGVDPWLPGTGREIILPMHHLMPEVPRKGIVINVAEQRLYWFRDGEPVVTHPIGAGREGYDTPLGVTKIVRRKEYPTWTPGVSARRDDPTLPAVVKAGPENPLGDHALYLAWPSYLIHGTNEPDGVGRRVSRGCIRLYPEDIASLFEAVPMGTQVRVIDEPVKVGWYGDDIVLEAHWTMDQATEVEETGNFASVGDPDVVERIVKLAKTAEPPADVDWARVTRVLEERRGVPVRITGEPEAVRRAAANPAASVADAAGGVADTVRDAVTNAVWSFGEWLELDEPEGDAVSD
jgi:L,D-transpeptidase ErfK/SrfK